MPINYYTRKKKRKINKKGLTNQNKGSTINKNN